MGRDDLDFPALGALTNRNGSHRSVIQVPLRELEIYTLMHIARIVCGLDEVFHDINCRLSPLEKLMGKSMGYSVKNGFHTFRQLLQRPGPRNLVVRGLHTCQYLVEHGGSFAIKTQ